MSRSKRQVNFGGLEELSSQMRVGRIEHMIEFPIIRATQIHIVVPFSRSRAILHEFNQNETVKRLLRSMFSQSPSRKRKRAASEPKINPLILSPKSRKAWRSKLRMRKFREKRAFDEKTKNDSMASLKASNRLLKRQLKQSKQETQSAEECVANFEEMLRAGVNDRVANDDETALSESEGSADPNDENFDPLDDSHASLDASGLRWIMERAQQFKTTFKMLTGHTKEDFEKLDVDMYKYIIETTMTGEKTQNSPANVALWKTRPREQLFVTLVWLRWHFTYAFLSFFTSLPARYVQKIVKRCTAAMARASGTMGFNGGFDFPTSQGDADKLKESQETLGLYKTWPHVALDGMFLRVARPTRPADADADQRRDHNAIIKSLTNAKYKAIGVTVLVLTDVKSGRILLAEGPFIGTESTLLKEKADELRERLRAFDLSVVADAGLHVNVAKTPVGKRATFYQSSGPSLVRLAKLVTRNVPFLDADKVSFFEKVYDSTRIASQYRIGVENSIRAARLFKVLSLTWRGRLDGVRPLGMYSVSLSDVIRAVFMLTNRRLDERPLRNNQFKVKPPDGDVSKEYGYPKMSDGKEVTNMKNVELAATRQFIPSATHPSLKKAYEIAEKIIKDRASGVHDSAKKQPGARKQKPKPLPVPDFDITDDEADDPTVVDDDDEPIVPTPRGNGLEKRKKSKQEAAKALIARRQEKSAGAGKRRRKGEEAD